MPEVLASTNNPRRRRGWRWAAVITAATAVTAGASLAIASAAPGGGHAAQARNGASTKTIPLKIVSLRGAAATRETTANGVGEPVNGTCGSARLIVNPGSATYDLVLVSTTGTVLAGYYDVRPDGNAALNTPGVIVSKGSNLWASGFQKIIMLPFGGPPATVSAVGLVTTSGAVCALEATAPWQDLIAGSN